MILRLRQLCCHPNLILVSKFPDLFCLMAHFFLHLRRVMKCQADDYDDPTLLVGGENEKELGRARRVMGSEWVVKIKKR
jgi:hypothetical protein